MADPRHAWFLCHVFRHREALHRYLRRFTSGSDEVDDLVQESYIRMYSLPNYAQIDSPKALLFRIAHNLAIERGRRLTARATDGVADFESLNVYSSESPPDELIDARRRFEFFCAAIEQLPPLCRRVFVLRKVYRLSHDEIGEVLGIAHSTIEKHVAKGLTRCRDAMREAGLLDGIEGRPRSDKVRRVRDGRNGE